MGAVTTSEKPRPSRAVPVVLADLELFWPSRRGHAFDEFCL
jgi:hypothetical protein